MKIEKIISEFVGGLPAICPFCNLQLVQREHRTILYCPMGGDVGPFCPYFFEIKQVGPTLPPYILNSIEMTLDNPACRVWISSWPCTKVIKIGEFNQITCVLLPIKNADISDMAQFKHRIKTILTFQ